MVGFAITLAHQLKRKENTRMYTHRALMGTLLALSVSLWISTPAFSNDDYGLPTAEPESLGMSTEKLEAIKANLPSDGAAAKPDSNQDRQ